MEEIQKAREVRAMDELPNSLEWTMPSHDLSRGGPDTSFGHQDCGGPSQG